MKHFLLLFLFATAVVSAQSDRGKADFNRFKAEQETYQSNPKNMALKPATCKEYTLKYTVTGQNFEEVATPATPKNLCADLEKYDTSKNQPPAGESYEIKAVGDRYYVIRVDVSANPDRKAHQIFYYYERTK